MISRLKNNHTKTGEFIFYYDEEGYQSLMAHIMNVHNRGPPNILEYIQCFYAFIIIVCGNNTHIKTAVAKKYCIYAGHIQTFL